MLKLKLPIIWPPDVMNGLIGKNPDGEKIESRKRKEQQRIRWLDGITDSMDMSLSKLSEVGKEQGSLACYSPWCCKESDLTE